MTRLHSRRSTGRPPGRRRRCAPAFPSSPAAFSSPGTASGARPAADPRVRARKTSPRRQFDRPGWRSASDPRAAARSPRPAPKYPAARLGFKRVSASSKKRAGERDPLAQPRGLARPGKGHRSAGPRTTSTRQTCPACSRQKRPFAGPCRRPPRRGTVSTWPAGLKRDHAGLEDHAAARLARRSRPVGRDIGVHRAPPAQPLKIGERPLRSRLPIDRTPAGFDGKFLRMVGAGIDDPGLARHQAQADRPATSETARAPPSGS